MKRNVLFASLTAGLFAATVAHAEILQIASAEGTIMEDVQPTSASVSAEQPAALVSPFPTQGPDDK